MSRMHLGISSAIISLVVFVAFALSVPHTRDVGLKAPPPSATSTPIVALHDGFKKGLHTITGSVETLNACTTVSASAVLVGEGSDTQSILVTLSAVPDHGVCLQVPTQTNFSTTLSASAHLPIHATVNGVAATTTIL